MRIHTMIGTVAAALALGTAPAAFAQSAEAFMGTVFLTANSYCPAQSLEAMGQTLPISQYQAMYSLLGTIYGGNGTSNFRLPDLRARSPVGRNVDGAPGMLPMPAGTLGGVEPTSLTLSIANLPPHTHIATAMLSGSINAHSQLNASTSLPSTADPSGSLLAKFPSNQPIYTTGTATTAPMNALAVQTTIVSDLGVSVVNGSTGEGAPVPQYRNPFLAMRYCIVMEGLYPPRP